MEYGCRLQVSNQSPGWPSPCHRQLLVIHGGPDLKVAKGDVQSDQGQPDAVVALTNFVLVIESKLGNAVTKSQLDRHCKTLSISQTSVLDVTWSKLARAAKFAVQNLKREPVTRFMLEQFEEYLRMNGFGGLTAEHFSFFAQPEETRDPLVKEGIRRVIRELGAAVRDAVNKNWETRPLNLTSGGLGAGILVHPPSPKTEPHLTIGIGASGVEIFANVETVGPYQKFKRAWEAAPDGLLNLVHDFGRNTIHDQNDFPWRFQVVHRVRLGPRRYHYWMAADVALNEMNSWDEAFVRGFVDRVIQPLDNEAVPEIKLIKSYPTSTILQVDDLPAVLSRDVETVEPYFKWLGVELR